MLRIYEPDVEPRHAAAARGREPDRARGAQGRPRRRQRRAASRACSRRSATSSCPMPGASTCPPSWTIAHVAQETPPVERSAIDYVLDGDIELREIEAGLASAGRPERRGACRPASPLRGRSAATARGRARRRCWPGLGFDGGAARRFGGELLRRLAHAAQPRAGAAVAAPTSCCSTSRRITSTSMPCCGSRTGSASIPGTLLLITHDRDFLDGVVDSIVHIDNRKLVVVHRQLRAVRACARAAARACSRRPTRSSSGRSRTCSRSSTASAPRPPRPSRRKAG